MAETPGNMAEIPGNMAETPGNMACAPSPPSKLEKKLSEQLNCAVCLATYKSPRSLACLHTFCEGCIRSHIVQHVSGNKANKSATIQCPLCKADTASPCPSKPRSEWASELPVNFALVPLLETMTGESKIECDNCRGFNKKSMATVYCKGCEQYQCDNCSSVHNTSTVMMKHKLIAVPEMTSNNLPNIHIGSLEYCDQHRDKTVEFYCEDDNALCCTHCAFSKHRQCKTVTELTALGQGLKDGDRSKTLDTEMGHLQTTLADLTDELMSDVVNVTKQTQNIPQKMILARNKIVRTLDQLVAKVTAECGQVKKQHSTELDDKITTVKSLQTAIMTTRSTLESLRKTGTVTQVFIVIHKLEEQVSQYQIQVKDVQNNMKKVDIDINFSEELNRLIENVDRLNATVVNQPRPVPMANCTVKTLNPVDIVQRGQLQQPGYVGSVFLPDGRHAVIDYKNNLCCLLDEFYTVTAEIKLTTQPRGIAVIGPRELVVALPDVNQLQIIRVQGNTLTLACTVTCTRSPKKLSRVSDTELAVAWDNGLGIINLNGQERSYFDKDKTGRVIPYHLDNDIEVDAESNRLFHSCWDNNTVYCMSYTGDVHFSYSNNLMHPCGMAIDRDGNLCICSHGTHTIHQISPTGQHIRTIDPGMLNPYTVCFNPVGDTMTVINLLGTTTKGSKVKFGSGN